MPGSPGTQPAPELPAERRSALVVATSTYIDTAFRQLRAPAQDAVDLSVVLADPSIGGFDVTQIINSSAQEIRLAIEEFVSDREPDDLLVIYLSCHGLIDQRRRLYFAATDTLKHRLAATGVESEWLLDQMEDCLARRQVVILDCCFSGAFARGAKGDTSVDLGTRFHGHGRGRIILTASRGTEYSFEGEPVPGSVVESGSVFTSALVKGLRTGDADRDHDGYISVDEAYTYAFDTVRAAGANQTPQRWLYGAEGQILLARNKSGRKVTPRALPESIRAALDNPHPAIRLGAIDLLREWLTSDDPTQALLARETLQHIADNDIRRVSTVARELLEPPAQSSKVELLPFTLNHRQLEPTEQEALVKEIGLAMLHKAPEGWERIIVTFRVTGRHVEVIGTVSLDNHEGLGWPVPTEVTAMFSKLREGMYRKDRGVWHNATYTLDAPSSFYLEYDRAEPQWASPPPPPAYFDELRMFPRRDDDISDWLTRHLMSTPDGALDSCFRTPRTDAIHGATQVDGDRLLTYLEAAPVVAAWRGKDPDWFDARQRHLVRRAFHTDGFWIWPAAMHYYLRTHGRAIDVGLAQHIRQLNFQVPHVNEIVKKLASRWAEAHKLG